MHPLDRLVLKKAKTIAMLGIASTPVSVFVYVALFATAAGEWPWWVVLGGLLAHGLTVAGLLLPDDLRRLHQTQQGSEQYVQPPHSAEVDPE